MCFLKLFNYFFPLKLPCLVHFPPTHIQCSSDSVFRTVGAICQALLNPVTLGAGSWSHWSDKQLLQGWTLFLPICGLFFCWVDLSIPSSCKGKITLILTFIFYWVSLPLYVIDNNEHKVIMSLYKFWWFLVCEFS